MYTDISVLIAEKIPTLLEFKCSHFLLEFKSSHFCPMFLLETKLAVCSPQVPGESHSKTCSSTWRELWQLHWPIIINICWIVIDEITMLKVKIIEKLLKVAVVQPSAFYKIYA